MTRMLARARAALFEGLVRLAKAIAGSSLTRIPGARAVFELLFRLFWSHGDVVTVQGSQMYVDVFHPDPSMRHTFRFYAMNRIHEETTTALFLSLLKPRDVVADLGANIGYFTMLAARAVGPAGQVFAFEPEPRNFRYLSKNIELNRYTQVTLTQAALADKPGTVKLFLCPYDTGHHTIQQFGGIQAYRPDMVLAEKVAIDVSMVTLDEALAKLDRPVDVIKMDVEGAELLALAGMERVIRSSPNLRMIMEFFPLLVTEMGHRPEELARRLLEDFGFEVYVVGGDYSMQDQPTFRSDQRIRSVDQLMALCADRDAHVNLFLRKAGTP